MAVPELPIIPPWYFIFILFILFIYICLQVPIGGARISRYPTLVFGLGQCCSVCVCVCVCVCVRACVRL
jgi:uncharacterized membrane protein (DUF485 family)